MGICWYCYWGWAKSVAEIYDRAIEELGDSVVCFGPAHVVFADENFDDYCVDSCIKDCNTNPEPKRFSAAEIARLREYLVELKQIPEEIRDCAPQEFWDDDENPEKYPPKIEVVKR